MATNDFLPFATATGANVETQASYVSDTKRQNGEATGPANSARANKAWRQATFVASSIAQFIVNVTALDVLDDANQTTFIAKLVSAINTTSQAAGNPVTLTSSSTIVNPGTYLLDTRGGPLTVTLPASPAAGFVLTFIDKAKTWGVNQVTFNPNGNTIQSLAASFTCKTRDARQIQFSMVWDTVPATPTWRLF